MKTKQEIRKIVAKLKEKILYRSLRSKKTLKEENVLQVSFCYLLMRKSEILSSQGRRTGTCVPVLEAGSRMKGGFLLVRRDNFKTLIQLFFLVQVVSLG